MPAWKRRIFFRACGTMAMNATSNLFIANSVVWEGEDPTMANEVRYFADYQFRWMYWRYFMWNFAGKQNDLQGFGNIRDGNWNSGINFVDNFFHSTNEQAARYSGKDQ